MWVKLRNSFISAKKRRKTKSGQAATKVSAWKFEKEMSFLTPFLEMRATHSNIDDKRLSEEEDDRENNETEGQSADVQYEENEGASESQQSRAKKLQRPKFRKSQTPAQEIVEIMKQNANARKVHYEETSKSKDLDETDMFYLSMAKTVKRLPTVEQAKIRMTLCQLVSEAEIRYLEGNYGRCSSSSLGSTMSSPPPMSPIPSMPQTTVPIELPTPQSYLSTPHAGIPQYLQLP